MKANEKRIARSYKALDKDYKKAMRQAKADKEKLAVLVEQWVIHYGKTGSPIDPVYTESEITL